MSKTFFISDLHFSHKNILKYQENRIFNNIQDMNENIISIWNNKVSLEDEVFILGDISLGMKKDEICKTLDILKGKKYLIKGNHDNFTDYEPFKEKFIFIKDYYELKREKNTFVLCHFPLLEWHNCSKENVIHLHGHVHGRPLPIHEFKAFDVGFDVKNDLFSLEEIIELAKDKPTMQRW